MKFLIQRRCCFGLFLLTACLAGFAQGSPAPDWLATGELRWQCSPALISPRPGGDDPDVALKDPTVVFHDGWWHLFGTHRKQSGKVAMQYLKFRDWADAGRAERHPLVFLDSYHCAPQVFYFTPHRKWYLVYQAADAWNRPGATLPEHFTLAPVFSTTTNLADPKSWSAPQPMIVETPPGGKQPRWIDFWVICDDRKAHLFYTSDDGHFWRRETAKEKFPFGWSPVELVLQDTRQELFEASHTYKLKGRDQYLTIIEALGGDHRYYKAWLADRLEGPWRPLAATKQKPFAAAAVNVAHPAPRWTDSVSHGELLRSRSDETLEVDPAALRFVFQGVDRAGYTNRYSHIPWRIGLLEAKP
jgi:hypothetical protein